MVSLKDIFNVWYGVNLEVVNSEVVEQGIPFVSRQSVNNGVVCHVAPIDGITPNPAHTLSIAVSGSVLSTFYHDYPYYSGRDVYVAEPKEPMTKEEMLYYAYIIEQNKYRYNYGRGANRTFREIVVPDRNEVPAYIREYKAEVKFKKEPVISKELTFNTREWQTFTVKELFKLEPTKGTVTDELIKGNEIPYIAAKHENNGFEFMCSRTENSDFISKGNCIVFINIGAGSAGFALYQGSDFIGMSGKTTCGYNENINSHIGVFLATILSKERPKYSFGRSWTGERLKETRIKLPVTPSGEPDWQFMENYIKSLPYSKNLEPVDSNILVDEILEYKKKIASLEHQLQEQKHSDVHYHINAENISLQTDGTINIGEINEK